MEYLVLLKTNPGVKTS